MATRMQQRRGTAAQWTAANPILASGEIGYETDTNKFKIGDGVTVWGSLVYYASADDLAGIIDGAPELLNTLNELAAAIGDDPSFIQTITGSIGQINVDILAIEDDIGGLQIDVSNKVNKSGETMTGPLTLNDDPTNTYHAATKNYVDTAIAAQ